MAAVNPLVQVAAVAAASRAVGFVAANDSDAPRLGPAISNKAYCETFFEINNVTNEHACKYEDCKLHKGGRKISANIKHGYTNLMSHLKLTHPDYVNDYVSRDQPGRKNAWLQFVTVKRTAAENWNH